MKRDEIDDLVEECRRWERREDLQPELRDFLRRIGLALIQEHTAYANEAYRSQGFRPWMRSSRT